jgi:hypothetical protein
VVAPGPHGLSAAFSFVPKFEHLLGRPVKDDVPHLKNQRAIGQLQRSDHVLLNDDGSDAALLDVVDNALDYSALVELSYERYTYPRKYSSASARRSYADEGERLK